MPYPFNESFETGIPAGFAAFAPPNGPNPSQIHNAVAQAVDLTVPVGTQGIWKITEASLTEDFSFEADLEFIEGSDTYGDRHFGLWLSAGGAPYEWNGIRFAAATSTNFDVRDWTGTNNVLVRLVSTPFSSTGVVNWKVEARKLGGSWWYKVWIGSMLMFDQLVRRPENYGILSACRPAIFAYGCTLRVHRVAGQSGSTIPLPTASSYHVAASTRCMNELALSSSRPAAFSGQLQHGWRSHFFGGSGKISGTTLVENIPASRQVRLYLKSSGLMVSEQFSSSTGHYEFVNIDPAQEYFVVAHDYKRVHNAVVQDMLVP